MTAAATAVLFVAQPAAADGNNFSGKPIENTRQDGLGIQWKAKRAVTRLSDSAETTAAAAIPQPEAGEAAPPPTSETSPPASAEAPPADGDIQVPGDLSPPETPDPLEGLNRGIFAVNAAVDMVILEPTARFYRLVVPKPVRRGVVNVLQNARAPVVLANDLLQGDMDRAGQTMARFVVNTTVGLGGIMDFAADAGVQHHSEDFGQTLAVWGVGSGPYLVAPLLGPSNPRDLTGKVVDTAFNPATWLLAGEPFEVRIAPSVAEMISGRESVIDEIDQLRKTSPDIYVSVRDIYMQKRQSDISNGEFAGDPIPDVSVPDISGINAISDIVTPK